MSSGPARRGQVLDRHLRLRQRARRPQFRRGPLSRRRRVAARLRGARAAQPRVVHRHPRRAGARSARSRPRLSGNGHLRRPLRDPDGARPRVVPALARGDGRDGEGRQRDDEDLGPRHGRSATGPSRSIRPYVLGAHRRVRRRSRRVRNQLAGRSHVQLLSRRHQRLCRDHLRRSRARSRQRCFPATPNASFGSEGGARLAEQRGIPDARRCPACIISASRWRASKRRSRSGRRSSASRRAGRRCSKALISAASSAIPNASIKAAFVDLPGGGVIELLDYHQVAERTANPEATANPGNVHLCLAADDAASGLARTRSPAARGRSARTARSTSRRDPTRARSPAICASTTTSRWSCSSRAHGRQPRMIKRVSFLRRKEGMSREEFFAHWTGPHAEIVKQLPGVRGLRFGKVQSWTPPEAAWDGVGELWFDSVEAARAGLRHRAVPLDAGRGPAEIHARDPGLFRRGRDGGAAAARPLGEQGGAGMPFDLGAGLQGQVGSADRRRRRHRPGDRARLRRPPARASPPSICDQAQADAVVAEMEGGPHLAIGYDLQARRRSRSRSSSGSPRASAVSTRSCRRPRC